MVVSEHGAAEICVDVTGNVWEDMCVIWLRGNCSIDIVTRWVLHRYTTAYTATSLVPTSICQLSRPHTRAGDIFSTTTPNCRPVTAAHELVTQSRLRYSSIVAVCPPLLVFRFAVPVAPEPRRAPPTSWPRSSRRRPPFFFRGADTPRQSVNLSDIIYRTIRT